MTRENSVETLLEQKDQQTTLNLGQQFQQARLIRQLTLEDVHQKIQLRPIILAQLETNQFHLPHSSPSFVKGYIRCYAKFLDIPAEIYEPVIQSLTDKTTVIIPKNQQLINDELQRSHWVNFAIILVVFTLVAVTVLWWWENHQQQNMARDELVSQHQIELNTSRDSNDFSTTDLTSSLLNPTLPKVE